MAALDTMQKSDVISRPDYLYERMLFIIGINRISCLFSYVVYYVRVKNG